MLKLTKERKVYAALLGLGLAALVADKLFLAPAGAGAATVSQAEPEAAPEPAKQEPVAEAAPQTVKRAALGQRLEQAEVMGPPVTADAFMPPGDWIRRPTAEAKAEPAAADPEEFARTHRVRLIVWGQSPDGADASVYIGSQPFRVGDTLDGYTLRSIEQKPRRAVFESPDHRTIELAIAESPSPHGPAMGR